MKGTDALRELGQSIWLDNITRTMLDDGTEQRYIDELSVTGQTSNPTIFDKAIGGGDAYDEQIAELHHDGLGGEQLFFDLALTDINRAAKMLHPIHERTERVDGWISLEVSPLLAYDTEMTIQQAADLHGRADENVFVKIPGTPEGLPAIEESIHAGIPINVTLLMSWDQYEAAADAFMRGIQRRIDDGLDPAVPSVASIFLSRWDVAVADEVPSELKNRLGVVVGRRAYRSYRELLGSERWQELEKAGAHPQRLLFASTGTKDPNASETLYVEGLAAPDTINTMPDKTLLATAELDGIGDPIPEDGGDAMKVMAEYAEAGIDTDELAVRLQKEGAQKFVDSWRELLKTIESESARLAA